MEKKITERRLKSYSNTCKNEKYIKEDLKFDKIAEQCHSVPFFLDLLVNIHLTE